MKNILLLVHDDVGQEARLQAALDVVRVVEGHLNCVDVVQIPVLYNDVGAGYAATILLEDEYAREGRNRQVLEQRLAKEGISWSWQDVTDEIAQAVTDLAGLADLIVLNRKLDAFPAPDAPAIAGSVLLRTHKPVLAVADKVRQVNINGRALIAWDGSAAATAAVRAAVPLLQLASDVQILWVEQGNDVAYHDEAARYLSRHGIHAELRQIVDDRRPVDEAIADAATHWQADWLVMGAYGHSRLREAFFGGVTRRMLNNSELPLLLAH